MRAVVHRGAPPGPPGKYAAVRGHGLGVHGYHPSPAVVALDDQILNPDPSGGPAGGLAGDLVVQPGHPGDGLLQGGERLTHLARGFSLDARLVA